MKKKRYVLVGVGVRSRFYYHSIARDFPETCELTALCDVNRTRMEYAQKVLKDTYNYPEVSLYGIDEFDKMIEEQKPDTVIICSIDRTHHKYIKRAMELGCDVVTEKPMTMDAEKCQVILDTVKRTGKDLRVAFNYRYSPYNSIVRKLIMEDTIGEIKQVHFEWMLDTMHGAEYFRRWHRDKRNSGGLLVHKSTHHFDLVNFWLDTNPKQVFAFGDLMFYGRENAENRGITKFYYRTKGAENAKGDPFALPNELIEDQLHKDMYFNAEQDDGYLRDQSVFSDGISIEDTMNVLVKYENGAQLSYSLNAFSPIEGFKVFFTGTKGRIELVVTQKVPNPDDVESIHDAAIAGKSITVFPMFKAPYTVEIPEAKGGHGGADPILLADIFGEPKPDPLKRAAGHIAGAMSCLTGIAANKSIATGMPVEIKSLVEF